MLRGRLLLREGGGCDLLTGKPIPVADPFTGIEKDFKWVRMYGCNTPMASEHLMTFRSGAAGYYDLARFGGTGNFGGFRSSCTSNLIVAGGLLVSPDYTRTCVCAYQNQTSVGLVPDASTEMWTFTGVASEIKDPIRRIGLNFGAPGDRRVDDGTLWLEYPSAGGSSPKPNVTVNSGVEYFRRHSSLISGPMPWVCASGARNLASLKIMLNDDAARPYTVRLYFAEPDAINAGDRVFDILLQDQPVASRFDVAAEAGAPLRSVVKEFKGVRCSSELKLELRGPSPILCGLEIIRE
jgi:hypothetical protein